jgi:hypothetical protein
VDVYALLADLPAVDELEAAPLAFCDAAPPVDDSPSFGGMPSS